MNIYEKLAHLRIDVLGMNIKKSGHNKHLNYDYYELDDLRPPMDKLCIKYKVCDVYYVLNGVAYLDLVNSENPEEKVTFSIPFGESNLKGCHPVQNVGCSDTYCQRYLLKNCMGVVDADVLECTAGKNDFMDPDLSLDEMVDLYIESTDGKSKEEIEKVWDQACIAMKAKKINSDAFISLYKEKKGSK